MFRARRVITRRPHAQGFLARPVAARSLPLNARWPRHTCCRRWCFDRFDQEAGPVAAHGEYHRRRMPRAFSGSARKTASIGSTATPFSITRATIAATRRPAERLRRRHRSSTRAARLWLATDGGGVVRRDPPPAIRAAGERVGEPRRRRARTRARRAIRSARIAVDRRPRRRPRALRSAPRGNSSAFATRASDRAAERFGVRLLRGPRGTCGSGTRERARALRRAQARDFVRAAAAPPRARARARAARRSARARSGSVPPRPGQDRRRRASDAVIVTTRRTRTPCPPTPINALLEDRAGPHLDRNDRGPCAVRSRRAARSTSIATTPADPQQPARRQRRLAARGSQRPALDRHEVRRPRALESAHVVLRPPPARAEEGFASRNVMAFTEDRNGRLWVGTFGGGIAIVDRATGHATRSRQPRIRAA